MILIFSDSTDHHAQAVAAAVERRGEAVGRLNANEIERWSLEALHNEPVLTLDGKVIPVDRIRSVFIRALPDGAAFQSQAKGSDAITKFAAGQRFAQFEDCIRLLSDCVPTINSIASTTRAQSKSLQLRIASKVGLAVPKTYVGSDPGVAAEQIRSFQRDGARACSKPIASRFLTLDGERFAGFTDLFEESDWKDIDSLRACPAIIQEYVEKAYEVRIAVVGDRAFACRIDSQAAGGSTAIDWRHYNIPKTPHTAYPLPAVLERRLHDFHAEFGLTLSSFDLVCRTDGEYVFLETNPFGRWLWLEDLAGLPITAAIADALTAR